MAFYSTQLGIILTNLAFIIIIIIIIIIITVMKFEREKFYPGPGIEPGPLALRASALPLRHPGQLLIQGRIKINK